MALHIYQQLNKADQASEGGTQTNPIETTHDGNEGETKRVKAYLANDDDAVEYQTVRLTPVDSTGTDESSWAALRYLEAIASSISGGGTISYATGIEPLGYADINFRVEIDSSGDVGVSTFKWSANSGIDWNATGVSTSMGAELISGISIDFNIASGVSSGVDFLAGDIAMFALKAVSSGLELAFPDIPRSSVAPVGGTIADGFPFWLEVAVPGDMESQNKTDIGIRIQANAGLVS